MAWSGFASGRTLTTWLRHCLPPFDLSGATHEPPPDEWLAALAILALAIGLRFIAWAINADLWLDEAELFQALRQQPAIALSQPLAEYTEATPFLPALLWKSLITKFGPDGLVLRLPSLAAAIAGLWILWLTVRERLSARGAAAALLLAGFSATAILQSAQLKPYSFEFLAAALIGWMASRLASAPGDHRGVARFAAISIGALAFTYTAPIATAGCGLGVLAALAATRRLSKQDLRRLMSWGSLWVVTVVLWHHWIEAPSTYLQFVGNERGYDWTYLVLNDPETWRHAGRILSALDPALPNLTIERFATLVICIVWAAGILLGSRRRIFEHASCLSMLLCLVVLSFARSFPLAEPRKFLFLVPAAALSFGAAIDDIVIRISTVRPRVLPPGFLILLLAVVLLPFALHVVADSRKEEVRELLDATSARICPVVWAYYMAWPALATYRHRRPDVTFLGDIPTASSVPSWMWKIHDAFPAYVAALGHLMDKTPGLCLLFSHTDSAKRQHEMTQLLAANAAHTCAPVIQRRGAALYRCK